MSSASNPLPPSLTTVDAMLQLADFVNSPNYVARLKELQAAEKAANDAEVSAKAQADAAQALLDDHAAKVAAHEQEVAQFNLDKAALEQQQEKLAAKLAKIKEAEAL
jgi:hypothetical protein